MAASREAQQRARNRYRYNEMVEVWNSYEFLFREKLEAIDHLTRQMIREMTDCNVTMGQVTSFVPDAFAALWEKVAEEQEAKTAQRKRG